jgi:hypothetical protein
LDGEVKNGLDDEEAAKGFAPGPEGFVAAKGLGPEGFVAAKGFAPGPEVFVAAKGFAPGPEGFAAAKGFAAEAKGFVVAKGLFKSNGLLEDKFINGLFKDADDCVAKKPNSYRIKATKYLKKD